MSFRFSFLDPPHSEGDVETFGLIFFYSLYYRSLYILRTVR